MDKNKSTYTLRYHSVLITRKGPIDFYDTLQEMNFINEHQVTEIISPLVCV